LHFSNAGFRSISSFHDERHTTNRNAEPDAGDEPPPRYSARSRLPIRACRSRSGLLFRRRSLSFAFGLQTMTAIFEPGLPGTGPVPVHLHTGTPRPWSEGCVVRFQPDSVSDWIGNLQTGYGYATKIIAWAEARALIVIAKGASYFVRPDRPEDWRFLDLLGIDCVVAPSRSLALLSTYTDVVAISTDGSPKWRRTVAVDGVEIVRIEGGLVSGRAGIDPPDDWRPFSFRLADGLQAEPGAPPNGGPAEPFGKSAISGGPPSVS
jgi:hypothetical protein